MYSTWRSGESSGYWDLHRRGFAPTALSVDVRLNDAWDPLGDRRTKEVDGESRGSPLVLGFEVDSESFEGRYGSVVAIVGGAEGRGSSAQGKAMGLRCMPLLLDVATEKSSAQKSWCYRSPSRTMVQGSQL